MNTESDVMVDGSSGDFVVQGLHDIDFLVLNLFLGEFSMGDLLHKCLQLNWDQLFVFSCDKSGSNSYQVKLFRLLDCSCFKKESIHNVDSQE